MLRLKQKLSSGFTLLEVMVVLVIIGVVLSVAMFSLRFSDDDYRLEREALKLEALINAAKQEAILNDSEIGLMFDDISYSFLRYENEVWVEMTHNKLWRRRELPEGFELELILADQPVSFPGPAEEKQGEFDSEPLSPQVYLLSTGEATPFEVIVRSTRLEAGSFTVEVAPTGRVEVLYDAAL